MLAAGLDAQLVGSGAHVTKLKTCSMSKGNLRWCACFADGLGCMAPAAIGVQMVANSAKLQGPLSVLEVNPAQSRHSSWLCNLHGKEFPPCSGSSEPKLAFGLHISCSFSHPPSFSHVHLARQRQQWARLTRGTPVSKALHIPSSQRLWQLYSMLLTYKPDRVAAQLCSCNS